jgi:amidase
MSFINDTAHAFMPYPVAPVPHANTGPLAGLSFGVKDLFDVASYPTSGGQPLLLAMSGIKTKTAHAVQQLLDAGAKFVGKTVTDELASSMHGNNAHFGAPINGAAPSRNAGGSSSGSSAAVSNHLCDFALGSDTGGSVRAPANHCGLYGMRPTHGRISLEGVLELAPSLDTCGYFARNIETFARVSSVLLGDDLLLMPTTIKLLKPLDMWRMLGDDVMAAHADSLIRIEAALGKAEPTQVFTDEPEHLAMCFRHLMGYEAWKIYGPFIERYCPPLGPGIAQRFEMSQAVTGEQYAAACMHRARFKKHLADVLGTNGVMVIPTAADIAPLKSDSVETMDDYRNRSIKMLCLAGLSGFPQISMPLGQRLGAPLGISLLGPAGSDMHLVQLAQRIAHAA